MHSFVRRLTLATVALPLLLGGCAEDEPDTSPPDPTASPPNVSEPVEPTLPPEAEGTGPEAAEALVRHYFSMSNYAQSTGDASGLRSLGTEECEACERAALTVDEIYDEGGRVSGGEATVENADVRRVKGGKTFLVTAEVATSPQKIEGSDTWGGDYPASTVHLRFKVVPLNVGLRIDTWGQA